MTRETEGMEAVAQIVVVGGISIAAMFNRWTRPIGFGVLALLFFFLGHELAAQIWRICGGQLSDGNSSDSFVTLTMDPTPTLYYPLMIVETIVLFVAFVFIVQRTDPKRRNGSHQV
jgi:TctA family transporter